MVPYLADFLIIYTYKYIIKLHKAWAISLFGNTTVQYIYVRNINLFVEDFWHPSSLSVCVIHMITHQKNYVLSHILPQMWLVVFNFPNKPHIIILSIQYGMSHQNKLSTYTVPTVIWSVEFSSFMYNLGESKYIRRGKW